MLCECDTNSSFVCSRSGGGSGNNNSNEFIQFRFVSARQWRLHTCAIVICYLCFYVWQKILLNFNCIIFFLSRQWVVSSCRVHTPHAPDARARLHDDDRIGDAYAAIRRAIFTIWVNCFSFFFVSFLLLLLRFRYSVSDFSIWIAQWFCAATKITFNLFLVRECPNENDATQQSTLQKKKEWNIVCRPILSIENQSL